MQVNNFKKGLKGFRVGSTDVWFFTKHKTLFLLPLRTKNMHGCMCNLDDVASKSICFSECYWLGWGSQWSLLLTSL